MIKIEQLYNLEDSLQKYFNLSSFRLGQKNIIEDILKGNDVLGVLPTGSGKSLCYQLPAKILKGTTIVVSPLISLMIDQVKQLKSNHFKNVIALNSFMEPEERRLVYRNLHTYKLIYVSPEILQNKILLQYLQQIRISLFVIDEAHCISQWGPEFRTDYLKLSPIIKLLNNPTLLALSATATPAVQNDIITSLERPTFKKHIYPMDRENIAFCVKKVSGDEEKIKVIIKWLASYRVPTLIYFSSRIMSEKIAKILSEQIPSLRVAFYHSGMDQMDRTAVQQQFMNDQLDVICSTSAFGMGINKSNIRLIIHFHFSPQLESYVQEIGRAGRDGSSSVSLLLYSQKDINIPIAMIKNELPNENELRYVFQQLYNMFTANTLLPDSEKKLGDIFSVNELQWRFLHYQFEKNGIVKGNTIVFNKTDWKQAFHHINNYRKERFTIKNNKLTEMVQWIHEKNCFRKQLYTKLQSSYDKPSYQCCSNCGFSFSNWKPKQTVITNSQHTTWDKKLATLLLIGVENESKRNN